MEESLIHVGIAAFDQNVHFFDLSTIQVTPHAFSFIYHIQIVLLCIL